MAQVTAIVYGVLASGAMVKLNHEYVDQGYQMPTSYYLAVFYRDHGFFLLFLVVAWAVVVSYLSSVPSRWSIDESTINITGIGLTIAFAILGTCLAFGGAEPPPHPL
jgi:hypothetical protein